MPQKPTASTPYESRAELERLERWSRLLDEKYLDPALGLLIPGFGDVLGSVFGLYGVWVARRIGAPPIVIARMLLNLALDALIGAIPVAGAIGDFFFRAHLRNLALLQEREADARARPSDYLVVFGAALLFLLALLVPLFLLAWLIALLFD